MISPSDHDFRDAVLSPDGPTLAADRLVALAVLQHAGAAGSFASERSLAGETALARNTVRAALRRLVAAGWLTREPIRRGKGGTTISTYRPQLPLANAGGSMGDPTGSEGDPLVAAQTVTQVDQQRLNGGSNRNPQPAQIVTLNSLNYEKSASAPAHAARALRLSRDQPRDEAADWERLNRKADEVGFRKSFDGEPLGQYSAALALAMAPAKAGAA